MKKNNPDSFLNADVTGPVLLQLLNTGIAHNSKGNERRLHSGLSRNSVSMLQRLIYEYRPKSSLEIGLAMGVSALAILYALQEIGNAKHTAIDPNQTAEGVHKWEGCGLTMVNKSGLSDRFRFINEPSCLALPKLVSENNKYDFILIDGWHSFEYAFVDYFFSDMLLNENGILVFDDWGLPQVHHVCYYLETHKIYERLSPRTNHPLNPLDRLKRRLSKPRLSSGWDPVWGSIKAYRKLKNTTVPWSFFHSNFYPYYWIYRWWMKARGLEAVPAELSDEYFKKTWASR